MAGSRWRRPVGEAREPGPRDPAASSADASARENAPQSEADRHEKAERREAQHAFPPQTVRQPFQAPRRHGEKVERPSGGRAEESKDGSDRRSPDRNLVGSGQGGDGEKTQPRRGKTGGQKYRSPPKGVSSALPSGKGPQPGYPVRQSRDGSRSPGDAVQSLQKARCRPDHCAAERTPPGVLRRVRREDRIRAGRNGLGIDRIQGAMARFHVTSPDNLSFNTALARKSLFLTVPSGMFLTPAISS